MIYYFLLVIATICFSFQFLLLKKFQQVHGQTLNTVGLFNFILMLTMCLLSLIFSKFIIEISLFSLLIAFLYSIVAFFTSYFGFKSLSVANLSLYTIFLMVGGMVIPFVYGAFIGERITIFKIIGLILLLFAVILPINLTNKVKNKVLAIIYYICIFIFNGLIGVLTVIHSKSSDHISDFSFIFWYSLFYCMLALLTFIFTKKNYDIIKSNKFVSILCPSFYALVNGSATLITLICAKYIDGSSQYPIITGGCIVVSCFSGLIFKEKPSNKTIISTIIAFIATVLFMF